MQTFQNKEYGTQWMRRGSWHAHVNGDLIIPDVTTEIKHLFTEHEARLHEHTNVEAIQILDNSSTRT